jgi:gliding motility-associated protein GldM
MASGNLSPRQKMINMMYLVLTALLALNVSKEVLNSFFEVNKGIERTTTNFNAKNASTYSAFKNAASNNPEKYQEVSDKAHFIKNKVDSISLFIQEMKYDLVAYADKNKVYFGTESDIYDADGDFIEDLAVLDKQFSELDPAQQYMPIAYLKNKSNRYASQDLFYPKNLKPGAKKRATELKEKIEEYRDFLIGLVGDNQGLINNINIVFDISRVYGKKKEIWEQYNFVDMPSVGALTILSKIQSDLRNMEADVIDYLKRDIDSKSLKFTSAEGIQIPQSNFVLRGDSFRSSIFISAKQDGQDPEIFVGDYDSIGDGMYEMVGEYETVKVVNGKGIFSKRETTEGIKKYGGLIAMKTETGTKMYPFKGEYLVAAKAAVVAPTNMNVLYLGIENPITVSVPGYPASKIIASTSNGILTPVNKTKGMYNVNPSKLANNNTPIISLFINEDGKRKLIGKADFKVKKVPNPVAKVKGKKGGAISKNDLLAGQMLVAEMEDFPFDRSALSFGTVSFETVAYFNNERSNVPINKGARFSDAVKDAIQSTKAGTEISFTNIKVKQRNCKACKIENLGSIIFKIR